MKMVYGVSGRKIDKCIDAGHDVESKIKSFGKMNFVYVTCLDCGIEANINICSLDSE